MHKHKLRLISVGCHEYQKGKRERFQFWGWLYRCSDPKCPNKNFEKFVWGPAPKQEPK